MHATLEAEEAVGAIALDLGRGLLEAARIRVALVQHRDLEAPALREADVHAEQLRGEQRGLLAAGAGTDLEDHILGVGGILGNEQALDLGLALGDGLLQIGDLHLGHLAELRIHGLVAQDEFGLLELLQPGALGLEGQHHRLQFRTELGELPQALGIRHHGRILQLRLHFLEAGLDGFKLVEHDPPLLLPPDSGCAGIWSKGAKKKDGPIARPVLRNIAARLRSSRRRPRGRRGLPSWRTSC